MGSAKQFKEYKAKMYSNIKEPSLQWKRKQNLLLPKIQRLDTSTLKSDKKNLCKFQQTQHFFPSQNLQVTDKLSEIDGQRK